MIKPTIHLNGTSRERLAEAYAAAVVALRAAIRATEDTAPNGRDYYPQGDGAQMTAIREHTDRMQRIRSVLEELTELRDHCEGE